MPSNVQNVYRTEMPGLGFGDRFDPVGETSSLAIGLYSQLLLRTLVTYRHVAGVAGTKVVPDLATDTGRVSSDGLTWTFTLKDGIHYAPPLNRSITSHDVAYAFVRMDTASLLPQFGMWFDGLIEGMDGPLRKAPSEIPGIETPNDRTIVFYLRHPAGDFPDRLALPATAPVPREVASCYHHAGWYGRTLVASGPYMIEGEDQLQQPLASCRGLDHPVRGFDPNGHLWITRNPNYDPSTDAVNVRSNFIDGVDIEVRPGTDLAGALRDLSSRRIDGVLPDLYDPLGNTVRELAAPNARVKSFADSGALRYLFMNLLVPPFDDIHVRRAVEFAVDRRQLASAARLPSALAASHLFRSPMLSTSATYDPYPHTLAAARVEMAKSRYDHDQDGMCDDTVCRNVLFLPCFTPPDVLLSPGIMTAFASVGVALGARELDGGGGCQASRTPANTVTVGLAQATPEYPDPLGLAERLTSAGIACELQTNLSEVGMTREQMRRCGLPPQFSGGPQQHAPLVPLPPSVDADVARCEALSSDARNACWDAFDHHVMEDIVPWIPLFWTNDLIVTGPTVVEGSVTIDQFSGLISLAHLVVNNNAVLPS